ncbi:hypothetical protein F4X10_11010 [Candidatus Poribacteria bacterium]|nr:hypothetical protein [Candidatus Poribacteria bacterium]
MATYDEWNKAIAEYFVSGLPSGSTVYLSVDEEALMEIGVQFEQSGTDYVNWVGDFTKAVRSKCVTNNIVYLPRDSDYQSDQIPGCVAFLAAMVLAAHYMIGEETEDVIISQINYFTRLRQVLGLPPEEGGRPDGLQQTGIEENLWQIWNQWLIGNGWLPSAERGHAIPNRYINYPLSQALLRDSDKRTMELHFREKEQTGELGRVWDRDTVGTWTRKQPFGAKHLSELLQEADFRQYDVITDAIYDVYLAIDWDQEMETEPSVRSIGQRRLTAHLYREEDGMIGDIEYYLYPRQPMKFGGGSLEIVHNGSIHPLREERQGWFMPLWPVDPAGGMLYEVKGHSQIKELVLPERNFWVLVRDPENEDSGVFADWGRPGLGETFILLCRKEYAEQMAFFKQEALLEWGQGIPIDDEWIEYRECMIVSASWEGIIPQYQDIYDELKPNVSATISLKGGLRVRNQGGWLEGYAPEITVFAFDESVELKLIDVSRLNKPIINDVVNTNQPISCPIFGTGDYLLEVYNSGRLATRRILRILPWDSLECNQPEQSFEVNIGSFTLRGAEISMDATESDGGE